MSKAYNHHHRHRHPFPILDQHNDPLITLQLSHVGIAVLIVEIAAPAATVEVVIGRRRKLFVQRVDVVVVHVEAHR